MTRWLGNPSRGGELGWSDLQTAAWFCLSNQVTTVLRPDRHALDHPPLRRTMRHLPRLASTIVPLLVLASDLAAQRGEVTAERSGRANAAGARMARVEARAGSLRITGREGV